MAKCLEKDAAKRYATGDDLAADIGKFLAGEPVTARPVGTFEKAWRWCRMNPVVSGSATAIAATLMVATVVSTLFGWEAKRLAGIAKENALLAEWGEFQAELQKERAEDSAATAWQAEREMSRQLQRTERVVYCGQIRDAETAKTQLDYPAAWNTLARPPHHYPGFEFAVLTAELLNQNRRRSMQISPKVWRSARTAARSPARVGTTQCGWAPCWRGSCCAKQATDA